MTSASGLQDALLALERAGVTVSLSLEASQWTAVLDLKDGDRTFIAESTQGYPNQAVTEAAGKLREQLTSSHYRLAAAVGACDWVIDFVEDEENSPS
jgi:hypothetical protein